jgi:hypothetical protein
MQYRHSESFMSVHFYIRVCVYIYIHSTYFLFIHLFTYLLRGFSPQANYHSFRFLITTFLSSSTSFISFIVFQLYCVVWWYGIYLEYHRMVRYSFAWYPRMLQWIGRLHLHGPTVSHTPKYQAEFPRSKSNPCKQALIAVSKIHLYSALHLHFSFPNAIFPSISAAYTLYNYIRENPALRSHAVTIVLGNLPTAK